MPLSAVPRLLLKLLAGRVGLSGSWWKPRHFLSVLRFVYEAEQADQRFARDIRAELMSSIYEDLRRGVSSWEVWKEINNQLSRLNRLKVALGMDTLEITVKITNVSKVGPDLWQVSFTLSSIGRDIKAIDLRMV